MKIEQVNGQFKNKFPCLSKGICLTPPYACDVIVACAVLYNIAKDLKEPNHLPCRREQEEPETDPTDVAHETGISVRANIVREFFSH